MRDTLNDRIERHEGDDWWCSRCGQSGKAADLTQPHNQHPNCDYTAIIVPADPIRKAFCAVAKAAAHGRGEIAAGRMTSFQFEQSIMALLPALYDALGKGMKR